MDELREKDISLPKNSACQDNKSQFLLEASRRSNTSCMQLYLKEEEGFPGESAASSILSRDLTGQGIVSQKSLGAQFQNHVRRLCAWRDLMISVQHLKEKYTTPLAKLIKIVIHRLHRLSYCLHLLPSAVIGRMSSVC